MLKKKIKTYIHENIVFNSSLHHAIHPLKNIAHIFPFNRNVLERNWEQIVIRTKMYVSKKTKKNMEVIRTEMCMT